MAQLEADLMTWSKTNSIPLWKQQVQLHSWISSSILLLAMLSHCSLWHDFHTHISHTARHSSPIRWQKRTRQSDFIWDQMSHVMESGGKVDGCGKRWGGRKREDGERRSQKKSYHTFPLQSLVNLYISLAILRNCILKNIAAVISWP